jgi:hypothetical protein
MRKWISTQFFSTFALAKTLSFFALNPATLSATELMPWFGPDKVFEWRNSGNFQWYEKIPNAAETIATDCFSGFYHTSLSFSPEPDWSAEAELRFGYTEGGGVEVFDHFKLTGRYLWMNDVAGDCISLSTGASVIIASGETVRDPATPHHNLYGLEGHIAVGNEHSSGPNWTVRYWLAGVLGTGFEGDGWLKTESAIEWQLCSACNQFRLFTESYLGFNGDKFKETTIFKGYDDIRHRSIDLGARFSHCVCCMTGVIGVQYAYRVYADNYPQNAHLLMIEYNFQIGL